MRQKEVLILPTDSFQRLFQLKTCVTILMYILLTEYSFPFSSGCPTQDLVFAPYSLSWMEYEGLLSQPKLPSKREES
jgi:hypothetical protein